MPILEEISTITAKGQTTVPKAVRQVLGVDVGDQIAFRVQGQKVTVVPVATPVEDPVIGRFLDLLAKDIQERRGAVKPLSKDFSARMRRLVERGKVDLDASIDGDVDL